MYHAAPAMMCSCSEETVLQHKTSACRLHLLAFPDLQPFFVLPAVRLILPGELAKHAVSEGTKAVTKFTSA